MEAIALFGGFGFCVLVGWLAFSRVGTWMESDAMQEVYRRETCGTIYVPDLSKRMEMIDVLGRSVYDVRVKCCLWFAWHLGGTASYSVKTDSSGRI